jgi:hypothetical protein
MVKNSCQGDEFYVKGKMSKFVHIIAIIDLRAKILQWAKYTKMGLLIVHCNKKISTDYIKSANLLTLRKI